MNEIMTKLIIAAISLVFTILSTIATYLINKYVKNNEAKTMMLVLTDLAKSAVLNIQQTYVDDLKKNKQFDFEAHSIALEKCINTIKTNMPTKVENWLKSNHLDENKYLTMLIEAAIKEMKGDATNV